MRYANLGVSIFRPPISRLAHFRSFSNKDITYCDPGEDRRNKLTGWVDRDFATDPDTRKSMTGYLISLNGGAVSWRSSRQGGVTLSNAEAEFVAASQAGQEAIYLRALLLGFNFRQVGATEIWEDNASCIMISENPANRERTRHVDTRVHYLRELVEMRRSAECGRCADQKPSASSSFQTSAIHVGHMYSFFSFLSLSQDWTAPDGVLHYHHTMRIPSPTRRLRNISSVCALVVCMYVLCVDMTRDAMIDTGGERNRV
jgi:hypothetical protein